MAGVMVLESSAPHLPGAVKRRSAGRSARQPVSQNPAMTRTSMSAAAPRSGITILPASHAVNSRLLSDEDEAEEPYYTQVATVPKTRKREKAQDRKSGKGKSGGKVKQKRPSATDPDESDPWPNGNVTMATGDNQDDTPRSKHGKGMHDTQKSQMNGVHSAEKRVKKNSVSEKYSTGEATADKIKASSEPRETKRKSIQAKPAMQPQNSDVTAKPVVTQPKRTSVLLRRPGSDVSMESLSSKSSASVKGSPKASPVLPRGPRRTPQRPQKPFPKTAKSSKSQQKGNRITNGSEIPEFSTVRKQSRRDSDTPVGANPLKHTSSKNRKVSNNLDDEATAPMSAKRKSSSTSVGAHGNTSTMSETGTAAVVENGAVEKKRHSTRKSETGAVEVERAGAGLESDKQRKSSGKHKPRQSATEATPSQHVLPDPEIRVVDVPDNRDDQDGTKMVSHGSKLPLATNNAGSVVTADVHKEPMYEDSVLDQTPDLGASSKSLDLTSRRKSSKQKSGSIENSGSLDTIGSTTETRRRRKKSSIDSVVSNSGSITAELNELEHVELSTSNLASKHRRSKKSSTESVTSNSGNVSMGIEFNDLESSSNSAGKRRHSKKSSTGSVTSDSGNITMGTAEFNDFESSSSSAGKRRHSKKSSTESVMSNSSITIDAVAVDRRNTAGKPRQNKKLKNAVISVSDMVDTDVAKERRRASIDTSSATDTKSQGKQIYDVETANWDNPAEKTTKTVTVGSEEMATGDVRERRRKSADATDHAAEIKSRRKSKRRSKSRERHTDYDEALNGGGTTNNDMAASIDVMSPSLTGDSAGGTSGNYRSQNVVMDSYPSDMKPDRGLRRKSRDVIEVSMVTGGTKGRRNSNEAKYLGTKQSQESANPDDPLYGHSGSVPKTGMATTMDELPGPSNEGNALFSANNKRDKFGNVLPGGHGVETKIEDDIEADGFAHGDVTSSKRSRRKSKEIRPSDSELASGSHIADKSLHSSGMRKRDVKMMSEELPPTLQRNSGIAAQDRYSSDAVDNNSNTRRKSNLDATVDTIKSSGLDQTPVRMEPGRFSYDSGILDNDFARTRDGHNVGSLAFEITRRPSISTQYSGYTKHKDTHNSDGSWNDNGIVTAVDAPIITLGSADKPDYIPDIQNRGNVHMETADNSLPPMGADGSGDAVAWVSAMSGGGGSSFRLNPASVEGNMRLNDSRERLKLFSVSHGGSASLLFDPESEMDSYDEISIPVEMENASPRSFSSVPNGHVASLIRRGKDGANTSTPAATADIHQADVAMGGDAMEGVAMGVVAMGGVAMDGVAMASSPIPPLDLEDQAYLSEGEDDVFGLSSRSWPMDSKRLAQQSQWDAIPEEGMTVDSSLARARDGSSTYSTYSGHEFILTKYGKVPRNEIEGYESFALNSSGGYGGFSQELQESGNLPSPNRSSSHQGEPLDSTDDHVTVKAYMDTLYQRDVFLSETDLTANNMTHTSISSEPRSPANLVGGRDREQDSVPANYHSNHGRIRSLSVASDNTGTSTPTSVITTPVNSRVTTKILTDVGKKILAKRLESDPREYVPLEQSKSHTIYHITYIFHIITKLSHKLFLYKRLAGCAIQMVFIHSSHEIPLLNGKKRKMYLLVA